MNSFDGIMEKIEKDDNGKFDAVVDMKDMRVRNGRICFEGDNLGHDVSGLRDLTFTDWGEQQFCTKIQIPHRYYSRCPNHLKDQNANEWLEEHEDRVRMRLKGSMVRGFVSDKYVPLDNKPLMDIMKGLLDKKDIDIKKFDVSDRSMHCRIAFPDLRKDIGTDGKSDILHAGVHITNSEVGSSAVHVWSMVYREICTNGLIADAGGEELLNQRHIHLKTYELTTRAAEAIGQAAHVGADVIDSLIAAKQEKIVDPLEVIKRLSKDRFTDKFTDEVLLSYEAEPDATKYALVNAFTREAQTLEMDRRVDVERFAGRLLKKRVA